MNGNVPVSFDVEMQVKAGTDGKAVLGIVLSDGV